MILVNGEACDKVGATDRGLAYGDGVFRTLAIRGGRQQAWAHHYRKLQRDCAAIGLVCPAESLLHGEVERATPPSGECAAKIMITRGASDRGYALPAASEPTRVVMTSPLPQYPAEYFSRGVTVRLCTIRLAAQPVLAGIKHLNRLENVLARAEWRDPSIAEGLMLDMAGNIVSGTMSNLIVVEGRSLVTPSMTRCGVAGVTRGRILAAAARRGEPCREEDLSLERIMAADALLLVNSLIGVWQVAGVRERNWTPHEMAQRVREWLDGTDA